MTTTQIIRLNQTQWKIPAVVHAVQNDTGRSLKMIIEDETIPSGATATLSINRADGTYYDITGATLNTADNSFTADITQALTTPGDTKCQLKVSGIVSTYTFIIEVECDTSGTVSPQEGISLAEAVEAAEDAADRAETAASTLELDATLSTQGKAADAKATGDAIDAVAVSVPTSLDIETMISDFITFGNDGVIIIGSSNNT